MKVLATVSTYDRLDITTTGYDVAVRDDGSMRIKYRSCWQGSRTGSVYIARATDEIMRAAREEKSDDEPDLETLVYQWLENRSESLDDYARLIRRGCIVR